MTSKQEGPPRKNTRRSRIAEARHAIRSNQISGENSALIALAMINPDAFPTSQPFDAEGKRTVYTNPQEIKPTKEVEKESRLDLSIFEPGSEAFASLVVDIFSLQNHTVAQEGTSYLVDLINFVDEKAFTGLSNQEVIEKRKKEKEELDKLFPPNKVNDGVNRHIRETYGIQTGQEKKFYLDNMQNANEVVQYTMDQLFPNSQNIRSMRNEVEPFQHDPSKILHLLVSSTTSAKLKFELQRQLANWSLSCEQNAPYWDFLLESKSNAIQDKLDDEFFAGLKGETRIIDVPTYHDRDTGSVNSIVLPRVSNINGISLSEPYVINYDDESLGEETPGEGNPVRNQPFEVREVLGLPHYTSIQLDRKKPGSSLAKMLYKAVKRQRKGEGTGIFPKEDVTDLVRLVAISLSDEAGLRQVKEKFIEILTNPENYGDIGYVQTITEDNDINANDNREKKKIRMNRLQIRFADMPIDVEIQFDTAASHLEKKFEYGEKDGEGKFTGNAHGLYKRYELEMLIALFFPEDYYKPSPSYESLEEEARDHIDKIAVSLRSGVHSPKGA